MAIPCLTPTVRITIVNRQILHSLSLGATLIRQPFRDSAEILSQGDKMEPRNVQDELERCQKEILALSRISAALSDLANLDAILGVALDTVLDVMDGAVGGILLLDEQSRTLYYRVHRGLSLAYVEQMRLGLGEGIAGRVAQNGKAILLGDISTDSRTAHPDLVSDEGLRAFISVPLRAQENVLGVINVASRLPRHFTTSDMHLLHSIGDQLGMAIEHASLYERLRRARERYQRLAQQTLVAEEDVRRKLAGELHDDTSQVLSGLSLQLQALVDRAEMSDKRDDELITRLKHVQSQAVEVHKEVGRLIRDLRPSLLDTLGLIPAIRQYAENNLSPLGIHVSVVVEGDDRRLIPEVEAGLFRWTQGAIGNIAQHSRANNTSIILTYRDDELFLHVEDDGQGFDVSLITDIEESGRGRGVFSMKERIKLLGGTCSIDSRPGQGTTVSARVPIIERDPDAED